MLELESRRQNVFQKFIRDSKSPLINGKSAWFSLVSVKWSACEYWYSPLDRMLVHRRLISLQHFVRLPGPGSQLIVPLDGKRHCERKYSIPLKLFFKISRGYFYLTCFGYIFCCPVATLKTHYLVPQLQVKQQLTQCQHFITWLQQYAYIYCQEDHICSYNKLR